MACDNLRTEHVRAVSSPRYSRRTAGKSEINANPRDTKDYPNGVWSLPPSFQAGPDYTPADARDRAKYAPIGESDRMTLKFVRVTDGAAR